MLGVELYRIHSSANYGIGLSIERFNQILIEILAANPGHPKISNTAFC